MAQRYSLPEPFCLFDMIVLDNSPKLGGIRSGPKAHALQMFQMRLVELATGLASTTEPPTTPELTKLQKLRNVRNMACSKSPLTRTAVEGPPFPKRPAATGWAPQTPIL